MSYKNLDAQNCIPFINPWGHYHYYMQSDVNYPVIGSNNITYFIYNNAIIGYKNKSGDNTYKLSTIIVIAICSCVGLSIVCIIIGLIIIRIRKKKSAKGLSEKDPILQQQ